MSQSTPYTKFGFDTEFFELVQGQKVATDTIMPSSTTQLRTQLEQQRQDGFTEGHAAGLAEGMAQGLAQGQEQAQADLAQLQQHLQNTLMTLQTAQTEREEQLLTQTLGLMRVTLHHLVGHAASHYAPELLEHHLRSLLPLLVKDEMLTLRINPAARGYHEKLGLPQAAIMGLPMHIQTDMSLGQTDAVVQWSNGGAESKLNDHLVAVDALLSGSGAQILPVAPRPDLESPVAAPAPPAPEVRTAPTPDMPQAPAPEAFVAAPEPAAVEADMETQAEHAARARANALLGDDDDLVDALK